MLYLEGRKKLLIEVGGFKVDPIQVQDVIDSHPGVAEAWSSGSRPDRPAKASQGGGGA